MFDELSGWPAALHRNFRVFSVAEFVFDELAGHRKPAEKIEFNVEQDFKIFGSRQLMSVVLAELLYNARESLTSSPRIQVAVGMRGGEGMLSVSDNDRCADEPLVEWHRSSKPDGAGFGLMACRVAALCMGGRMQHRRLADDGCEFAAVFPVCDEYGASNWLAADDATSSVASEEGGD
jgi:C4-dicarboxylate-specific signal transduction histidine kinase